MANDSIECSDKDLEPFIRNTFSVQLGNSTTDTSDATDVGIVSLNKHDIVYIVGFVSRYIAMCDLLHLQTTADFEEEIREMVDYRLSGFSSAAYHAYDAVWTLALGIDRYNNHLPTVVTVYQQSGV